MLAMNKDRREESSPLRVLLLTTVRSYRGRAFLEAAAGLGLEVIQAIDMPQGLAGGWDDCIELDFAQPHTAVDKIREQHLNTPFVAILATDDSGTTLAALASAALGLPHNSVSSAAAARDKSLMRQELAKARILSPSFLRTDSMAYVEGIAAQIGFPCVVKPLNLNGSRGVIRANDETALLAAITVTSGLLQRVEGLRGEEPVPLLVESYIPGVEVALEGLLVNGRLQILALFDKPDPLEGPYFEETLYVTPSRLDAAAQKAIMETTQRAAEALGLSRGPIHAELRVNEDGPWVVELAGRSIGGLCSQILRFGMEAPLEELILRQACGLSLGNLEPSAAARGVMMIPIPQAGLLRRVEGMEVAARRPLVTGVEITAPLDNPIVPLPEGDGYLGFIFAQGESAAEVEAALRTAHQDLTFVIDPLLALAPRQRV